MERKEQKMSKKIDAKIKSIWQEIRELYKTYGRMPRTSYWYKPYRMWLGQGLYAIKILKGLK